MAEELYRFVQMRGVIPAEVDDDLLIHAWSEPPTGFESSLADGDAVAVSQAFVLNASAQDDLRGLRRLDASLSGAIDDITVESLRDAARTYMDVPDVLNRARIAAQDRLAATLIVPDAPPEMRDEAHWLVVLAAASQRAWRWGSDQASVDERAKQNLVLRDILGRGAAVLSPRVSRLIGPGPAEPRPEATDDPKAVGAPQEIGRSAVPQPERSENFPPDRNARNAVLGELIRLVVDPELGKVVVPAIENPPDTAAPRLRRVGEVTLRQPRASLDAELRGRLSEEARKMVDLLAPGETDLPTVINAIDTASLPSNPVALAMMVVASNDPTGGFPPGSGALRAPLRGMVRSPGLGELLSVRREHKQYLLGPITYIENVLKGETRSRTHRRLDRTEETIFTETERTVVDERDLQRTERFDLAIETRNEVSSQSQIQFGAQVSGGYGPIQASSNFGFTSTSARKESTEIATTTSRETVDRALNRITERTLERRQRITITEFEETNKHELANAAGGTNLAGIYRFVDDEQTVGVYSYGRRLMIEVHVPEPGAYLRWADAPAATTGNDPRPPYPTVLKTGTSDMIELRAPSEIDPSTYLTIDGRYMAAVQPPPGALKTVGMADKQEYTPNTPQPSDPAFLFYKSYERLKPPDGYEAISAAGVMYASAWAPDVYIAIDGVALQGTGNAGAMPYSFAATFASPKTDIVPVAMTINNAWGFAFTMELTCQRSARLLSQWQAQTFAAVMQAYDDQLSAWEERQRAASVSSMGLVTGTNPAINRTIERSELKKGVISLLSGSTLHSFGAISEQIQSSEPTIDDVAAVGQSAVISFYEQAFEWENATFALYPYFWGRHASWPLAFEENGADPVHDAFLRAGLARVVVPVRPGFWRVALWFLATGQVWRGGSPPPISNTNPLYRSIAAELLAVDSAARGGVLQGDTWPAVTPTNLVYLQSGAELNPPTP